MSEYATIDAIKKITISMLVEAMRELSLAKEKNTPEAKREVRDVKRWLSSRAYREWVDVLELDADWVKEMFYKLYNVEKQKDREAALFKIESILYRIVFEYKSDIDIATGR